MKEIGTKLGTIAERAGIADMASRAIAKISRSDSETAQAVRQARQARQKIRESMDARIEETLSEGTNAKTTRLGETVRQNGTNNNRTAGLARSDGKTKTDNHA